MKLRLRRIPRQLIFGPSGNLVADATALMHVHITPRDPSVRVTRNHCYHLDFPSRQLHARKVITNELSTEVTVCD